MIQILIVGEIMSKFFFKIKIFFKKINSFLSKGQIGDGKSGINILFPVAVSNTGVLSGKNILLYYQYFTTTNRLLPTAVNTSGV
jgi:hypothetical protein